MPAAPGDGQTDGHGRDAIEPVPAREPNHQGTKQHSARNRRIRQQVHHRSAAVEIMLVAIAKQASRQQVHANACRRRQGHRSALEGHRVEQALQAFDKHDTGRHQDQNGIQQRGQLGTAAKAIGETLIGRATAQPLGPPAQQEARHIAQVMDGIPDQGHGAKTKADHQLQTREAAIEDHAPAEGGGGAEAMDVLTGMGQPLDPYGGVANRAAAGVVVGSHGRWRQQAAGGLGDGKDACRETDIPRGELWSLANPSNSDQTIQF